MPAKLFYQILPRGDRLGSQTLVSSHSPFPQCGRKKSAPDGAADHTKVEDGIDVVNMFIRVRLPVISSKLGRFLKSRKDGCPHDFFRERAARIFVVAAMWRTARRSVAAQGCWALVPVVSPTSARGRALFGHEHQSLRRPTTLLWSF
ncbi:hypothetical protein A2U01_0049585, partial [Trifolium medium]|nr:hypothetical protein [Trifolium medium]